MILNFVRDVRQYFSNRVGRFMPNACWTVFAPLLDIFSNFQPVKSLPKFFDGLLNSEVTTDSTSVSELEYFLPSRSKDNCSKRYLGFVADNSPQAENAVLNNKLVKPRPVVPQVVRFFLRCSCRGRCAF